MRAPAQSNALTNRPLQDGGGAIWVTLAMALAVLATPFPAEAADDRKAELDDVKAAYVYRICQYVTWPKGTFKAKGSPIRIVVLGDPGFARKLGDAVKGKMAGGRAFEVESTRILAAGETPQVVLIGDGARRQADALIERFEERPTLTMAHLAGFAERGGRVNFVVKDGRLRFEVNHTSAKKGGLKLSARLLTVALKVYQNPR